MTFTDACKMLKGGKCLEISLSTWKYTTVVWLGDDGFFRQVVLVGECRMASHANNLLHLKPEDVLSKDWDVFKTHLTSEERKELQ